MILCRFTSKLNTKYNAHFNFLLGEGIVRLKTKAITVRLSFPSLSRSSHCPTVYMTIILVNYPRELHD